MRNINAIDLLNVWEQGVSQLPLQRALILLVIANPETKPDELAKLSIGQRDVQLLQLREHLFGVHLVNSAICPACSERIEWENKTTDIRIVTTPKSIENSVKANNFTLHLKPYHIHFHLPNSLDIAATLNGLGDTNDKDSIQTSLLRHCIVKAKNGNKTCEIDQLPKQVIKAVSKRIEALDSQAEVLINLNCPACSHQWKVLFDISSFLWSELNDWAERTLRMIHTLARGYGWTEQEILKLSPIRRQLYLGMLQS